MCVFGGRGGQFLNMWKGLETDQVTDMDSSLELWEGVIQLRGTIDLPSNRSKCSAAMRLSFSARAACVLKKENISQLTLADAYLCATCCYRGFGVTIPVMYFPR